MLHKGNKKIGRFTNFLKNDKHLQKEVQIEVNLYKEEDYSSYFVEDEDDFHSEYLWFKRGKGDIMRNCYNQYTHDIIKEVSLDKALADIDHVHNVGQSVYYNSDFLNWEEAYAKIVPGFTLSDEGKEALIDEIVDVYSRKIINDLLSLNDIDFNVFDDDRFIDYEDLRDLGWKGGAPMSVGVDATVYRIRHYSGDVEIDVATTPYSNRRRIRVLLTDYEVLVTFDHYDSYYELEVVDGMIKLSE